MENYLPLTQSYAGQWRILSYEKLANSPETEFRRLFAELNLTPPNDLSKRLTTQSRSSWNSSKRREAATTAWRNELTPAEISEIEAVIEVCGLASFFSWPREYLHRFTIAFWSDVGICSVVLCYFDWVKRTIRQNGKLQLQIKFCPLAFLCINLCGLTYRRKVRYLVILYIIWYF